MNELFGSDNVHKVAKPLIKAAGHIRPPYIHAGDNPKELSGSYCWVDHLIEQPFMEYCMEELKFLIFARYYID